MHQVEQHIDRINESLNKICHSGRDAMNVAAFNLTVSDADQIMTRQPIFFCIIVQHQDCLHLIFCSYQMKDKVKDFVSSSYLSFSSFISLNLFL